MCKLLLDKLLIAIFIASNHAAKLRNPRIPRRIPRDIKTEEIEMLRIACKTTFEYAVLEILFASGCKVGELHHANHNKIDWNNRSLRIIGKEDRERTVFFDIRCSVWLKKYLADEMTTIKPSFSRSNALKLKVENRYT